MKRIAFLAAACFLHNPSFLQASSITDVTVYPDRAQVTRTAEFDLIPGENRLEFGPLPLMLDDNSVRAAGQAATPVTIQDVTVRRIVREQLRDEEAAKLEQQLLDLRDQRTALDARQRVLDQQRNLLNQIQVKAAGDAGRDIQINKFDLAQLKDLPAYLAAEFTKLEEAAAKINADRRDLDRKIQVAEAEFNKRRAAANRTEKTAFVTVHATAAAKLKLQLTYVLGNASWVPLYDARSLPDDTGVNFTYNATVRQQTGEDWRGVNLTLSTARPAIGARMPELGKWIVDFMQMMPMAPASAMRQMSAGKDMNGMAAGEAETDFAAVPQQMQIEQGATAVTFRVPRPADVPSDGEPRRQTIATQTIPASFLYETTPKLSPFAYLKAAATNNTTAPFLAGQVNIFVGPDFVGTGNIATVAPTEGFDLFLGVDEGIRIKREELKDKTGKAGLFRNRQKKVFAYKITVENYKTKPARVVVYDQLPVSANDDIKVAPGETVPTLDKDTGKLTWPIELKPREKRELTFDFTVDWPTDKPISGL